jgi:hypothetical protein
MRLVLTTDTRRHLAIAGELPKHAAGSEAMAVGLLFAQVVEIASVALIRLFYSKADHGAAHPIADVLAHEGNARLRTP